MKDISMTREEIVAGTLQWCNERRKEKELEPLDDLPKGERWDGNSCPCGNACGYYVGYSEYYESQGPGTDDTDYPIGDGVGEIPECVAKFARNFDAKKFPEYELRT
jgi:hypothetical protein